MFVSIANTPRDYAWGSTSAMAELLGTTPSGRPEAELWLGAHAGSPSRIAHPDAPAGSSTLAEWIEVDPAAALGDRERLPFLMKVLAAASPLSLQAHPSAEQAKEGFARENALGIPLDAPHRNYRDEFPKPEVIVAVSDTFEALCGFRPVAEAEHVLTSLGLGEPAHRLDDLPGLFEWLMRGGAHIQALLTGLMERVTDAASAAEEGPGLGRRGADVVADALDTVRRLSRAQPGDPGILCALLLNRVTLRAGEALYLPAGNIHAYLEGVGIEVMSASDNVLRGGLTPKHVDVDELVRVLDFTPGPPPWLRPERHSAGVELYRPDVDDFVLAKVTGAGEIPLHGPAIALCIRGTSRLAGSFDSAELSRGESVYISPDEARVSFTGSGEVFLATVP